VVMSGNLPANNNKPTFLYFLYDSTCHFFARVKMDDDQPQPYLCRVCWKDHGNMYREHRTDVFCDDCCYFCFNVDRIEEAKCVLDTQYKHGLLKEERYRSLSLLYESVLAHFDDNPAPIPMEHGW